MDALQTEKPLLFISHMSEEADFAALLKQSIEEDFGGRAVCFQSSDMTSVQPGDDWLATVRGAIGRAAAVLVLCSKASVQKPWVQFEIGAASMRDLRLIPICHSGMKVDDLSLPLSRQEALELGTPQGLQRLSLAIARVLGVDAVAQPALIERRLQQVKALEASHPQPQLRQFERYIDIVMPPERLEPAAGLDAARIESNEDSLRLFGLMADDGWTWHDIVAAARKRPDTRWIGELQRCIKAAAANEQFTPVQAIYHAAERSYQPQLARKEVRIDGSTCFHVHFVETVVAPLFEVQNDFGVLATMLRLGLRYRYEVIERAQRPARALRQGDDGAAALLRQLRAALDVIEKDALSRGAEHIEPQDVVALFERPTERAEMACIMREWQEARGQLLRRSDAPMTRRAMDDIVERMRRINGRFMSLCTARFHELVESRWDGSPEAPATVAATPRAAPAGAVAPERKRERRAAPSSV